MATLNISLPDAMKAFVETRISEGTYGTVSEYFRDLIREDQKRRTQERLDILLLEGLDSGPPIEVNEAYWEQKRRDLLARYGTTGNSQ